MGKRDHTHCNTYHSLDLSSIEKKYHDDEQQVSELSVSDKISSPTNQAGASKGRRQDVPDFDTPGCLAYEPTRTHKGLSNYAGENNCFLNVTIQALWHLGPFRHEIQKLLSQTHINASNSTRRECLSHELKENSFSTGENYDSIWDENSNSLLDALCNLFVQYEFAELQILPPTELRATLSKMFGQFRLGAIADSNETLEAILERIHLECTPSCPYGKTKCLAHTVFGGLLMEQSVCQLCGASSEPTLRNDFLHYVYAAELISLHQKHEDEHKQQPQLEGQKKNSFQGYKKSCLGNLLHECLGVNARGCPSLDDNVVKEGSNVQKNVVKEGSNNSGDDSKYRKQKYENGYGYTYGNDPRTEFTINTQCNLDAMRGGKKNDDKEVANDDKEVEWRGAGRRREHVTQLQKQKSQRQEKVERKRERAFLDHSQGHAHVYGRVQCKGTAAVKLHSLDPASVLALCVGWTKQREDFETLESFFSLLSYTISLSDLFDIDDDSSDANKKTNITYMNKKNEDIDIRNKSTVGMQNLINSDIKDTKKITLSNQEYSSRRSTNFKNNPSYVFRGFVCYYGSHYVSIFQVAQVDNRNRDFQNCYICYSFVYLSVS